MITEKDIYDFETAIENAAATSLTAAGLTTLNTTSSIDLQKSRPRVELMFVNGAGRNQWFTPPALIPTSIYAGRRETAWRGQMKVGVVTASDFKVHSSFRATARAKIHGIVIGMNKALPLHCVEMIYDRGCSVVQKPQDDEFLTSMIFEIDFCIRATSWALVQQQQ